MKPVILVLMLIFGALFPAAAFAGSADVVVESPWSRASIGTIRPGVAYMTIRNTGTDPVTLTGMRSDAAGMPMLHKSSTDASGMASMAPAGDIVIPAGGSISLEPGGLHAMLMHLTRPLVEGDSFPLVLLFDDGGEVSVQVPVLGPGARGPGG